MPLPIPDPDRWYDDEELAKFLGLKNGRVVQKKRAMGSLPLKFAKWGHRPHTLGKEILSYQYGAVREPKEVQK